MKTTSEQPIRDLERRTSVAPGAAVAVQHRYFDAACPGEEGSFVV
jgi:hypothetical protein